MRSSTINNNSHLTTIKYEQHPFHLVKPSPWPFELSFSLSNLLILLVLKLHGIAAIKSKCLFLYLMYHTNRIIFVVAIVSWFWDIILEATFEGRHTRAVQQGLRIGFILFIVSEIIFFFSFFWAFFYLSVSPSIALGCIWPPLGIKTISPFGLPFYNTVLLVSSGVVVTWAHIVLSTPRRIEQKKIPGDFLIQFFWGTTEFLYKLFWRLSKYLDTVILPAYAINISEKNNKHSYINFSAIKKIIFTAWGFTWYRNSNSFWRTHRYNARKQVLKSLYYTVLLGVLFTSVQLYEYTHAKFSIDSTAYGSTFYLLTGFHGLHVLVGTIFLVVCYFRHKHYHFTRSHHVGVECAIWYWHFVDIVWIFLFVCLYWWGGL